MNLAWGRRFGLFKVLFLMSRLLHHASRGRFLSNHRSLCGNIRIRCIGTKIPCRVTNRFLCDDLVVGIHDRATILARGRHRLGAKSSRFRHHLLLAIGTLRRRCRGIRFRQDGRGILRTRNRRFDHNQKIPFFNQPQPLRLDLFIENPHRILATVFGPINTGIPATGQVIGNHLHVPRGGQVLQDPRP